MTHVTPYYMYVCCIRARSALHYSCHIAPIQKIQTGDVSLAAAPTNRVKSQESSRHQHRLLADRAIALLVVIITLLLLLEGGVRDSYPT